MVDRSRGDRAPDDLITRDFAEALDAASGPAASRCSTPLPASSRPLAYAHVLATLREELPHIVLYRPDWPGTVYVNSFVATGAKNTAEWSFRPAASAFAELTVRCVHEAPATRASP